jgi:hypothetical protein
MIKWLFNACPFAPGVAKPVSMPRPDIPRLSLWNRVVNRKNLVLGLSMVTLMLMYIYNYPSLDFSGMPLLFEDYYFVKMSMYGYVASMIGYYIREYKKKQRQG